MLLRMRSLGGAGDELPPELADATTRRAKIRRRWKSWRFGSGREQAEAEAHAAAEQRMRRSLR